jgi:hypothetical protein
VPARDRLLLAARKAQSGEAEAEKGKRRGFRDVRWRRGVSGIWISAAEVCLIVVGVLKVTQETKVGRRVGRCWGRTISFIEIRGPVPDQVEDKGQLRGGARGQPAVAAKRTSPAHQSPLPAVALILMDVPSMRSGVGSGVVPPAPEAS